MCLGQGRKKEVPSLSFVLPLLLEALIIAEPALMSV